MQLIDFLPKKQFTILLVSIIVMFIIYDNLGIINIRDTYNKMLYSN
jgi:hypothetical protein